MIGLLLRLRLFASPSHDHPSARASPGCRYSNAGHGNTEGAATVKTAPKKVRRKRDDVNRYRCAAFNGRITDVVVQFTAENKIFNVSIKYLTLDICVCLRAEKDDQRRNHSSRCPAEEKKNSLDLGKSLFEMSLL